MGFLTKIKTTKKIGGLFWAYFSVLIIQENCPFFNAFIRVWPARYISRSVDIHRISDAMPGMCIGRAKP